MRAFLLTLVGTTLGQDIFLSKYNTSEDLDATARRRRRRRRSSGTCAGGDLPTCVNKCLASDDENFQKCESGGSTDCSGSKCCKKEGWSCFVKNAYWSSCAPQCKTGIPDARGETWDCTPISASKCKTLQPCVNSCHKNCPSLEDTREDDLDDNLEHTLEDDVDDDETAPRSLDPRPTRGPDAPRGRGATGCRGGSMKECKSACHYADKALEKMCNEGCEETCPEEPPVKCPKQNLGVCVSECQKESVGPQHNDGCEEDGRTSCLKSRCCKNPSDKCYTKNKYWAACQDECVPGKKNKNDNMIWQCKELKPREVCDDYLYRTCVSTCATQCLE